MKKAYEAPALDVLRLDIPDSITSLSVNLGNDLTAGEGVEDWTNNQ